MIKRPPPAGTSGAGRRLVLAAPRGFCAGVRRAVAAADEALRRFAPPVYCLNEIVHNRQVVDRLSGQGLVFVRSLHEVPAGSVLLFSAHGVPPEVRRQCADKHLRVIDATCPFVDKVHVEVRGFAARGYTVILVGKRGHDEILGVAGEAPGSVRVVENVDEAARVAVSDPARVAMVSQTTLSPDDTSAVTKVLGRRFPGLVLPAGGDICYATLNRQQAVRAMASEVRMVLVLGSANSSNSQRLIEVAAAAGVPGRLVEDVAMLTPEICAAADAVGLTAGASVPESFVDDAVARMIAMGYRQVREVRVAEEDMCFRPPRF